MAFVCGLGTFGLSKGLITARGRAGRLGSLVTNLPLTADERPYSEIYEYCTQCGACVKQCPVAAITIEAGKNHQRCSAFLDETTEKFKPRYGCGKCQVNVPCESHIPLSPVAKPTTTSNTTAKGLNLWSGDSTKDSDRIVVISDLHLGLDDSFSETVKNKAYIVSFLNQLTASDVDELVIDGDLLDEWFIPTGNSQPADLQEFFTKDADNNRTVIDAIKSVMKSGIKVTYIPGNHDMLLNQAILSAILYANVQRRWDALQDANGVAVKLPYATATAAAQDATFCDQQAVTQYFNVDPSVDVVVFGHTHVPVINRYPEGYNREKVYANSGTWIDRNLLGADMTFVAIESGKDTTDVRLMQYQPDGTVTNLEQQ